MAIPFFQGKPDKPIKSVLVFKWAFSSVITSMDKLEERLKDNLFYVLRPRNDVIAATSLTNPSMIIFVIIQNNEKGGDIIVLQNPGGWYSEEDIVEHMPLFFKTAGIKMQD